LLKQFKELTHCWRWFHAYDAFVCCYVLITLK